MSLPKTGKTLPIIFTDEMVAKMVSEMLRKGHDDDTSVIKKIAQTTGANLHTIKKWCEARSTPKSANLLMLATCYPAILQGMLEMLAQQSLKQITSGEVDDPTFMDEVCEWCIHYRQNVGNQKKRSSTELAKLNHRQLWFLQELRLGKNARARDIAYYWKVAPRTAERDIAGLLQGGMAQYIGSRRSGYYTMC